MFADERRRAILEHVRVNGAASLRDLAAAVNSSEVTVRRDIRLLQEQGLLDRRRGGAMWPGSMSHEQTYHQKTRVAVTEKVAIAVLAATFVDEGDAIVLGAGTTTYELARALARMADLTVVTNSVLVAQALAASSVEVVMTGGSLRGSTLALLGSLAEESLSPIRVRSAFLSGNGLTSERGLSTPVMASAGVDRAIARCAQDVVVLADHTKIGVDTMFQTVPVESIRHLITDDGADPEVLAKLTGKGVQVHVAPVRAAAPGELTSAEPVG
jgi:DeoR/GlpR family transcriptional regulator of sugar metabolism